MTIDVGQQDARFCKMEFLVEGENGKLYPVQAWLEDNEFAPSLQCQHGTAKLGMTLANDRCRGTYGEIEEIVLLTREFYRYLRQVCYLPPKEPPYGCPVSAWIGDCLESMKRGKDVVLERA